MTITDIDESISIAFFVKQMNLGIKSRSVLLKKVMMLI